MLSGKHPFDEEIILNKNKNKNILTGVSTCGYCIIRLDKRYICM